MLGRSVLPRRSPRSRRPLHHVEGASHLSYTSAMPAPFAIDIAKLPRPYDPGRAARTLETLAASGYRPDGPERALIESASGSSPYLSRLLTRDHKILLLLFATGPARVVENANARALAAADASDANAAMAALRIAKREAALAIALADIAGAWDVETVTRA